MLVICNTKRTQKYVSSALNGYITDSSYLRLLLSLRPWLKTESTKRQIILKRIFDKRKVEVGSDGEVSPAPEVKLSAQQKLAESKLILE